jgi:Putative Flp pilus-assembly TadE/G-like
MNASQLPLHSGAAPRSMRTHRPLSGTELQEGSISAFIVLMLVALFALFGLVLDGGRAMSAQQAAQDEAEQAARAGAGALSVDALRSGQVALDQQAAISSAEAYTVTTGHPGLATVTNGVVTVTIDYRMPTSVLGMVGITSLPVAAHASAVNVHGVTREEK